MKIFKQIKNIIIPISAISFIFISHEKIEAKVIGKFAHGAASTSEYGKTITEFANRVNSRTNTLEIQVFGDGSFGGTQTLIEGVQLGMIHLSPAGYGSLGAFVPEFGAMELPFIFGRKLDVEKF